MTCLLTHLIVIPDFSLTLLVLPLIPYSVFPHAPTLIVLTQVISSSSLATHSHDLGYQPHTLVVLTPLVLPLTHTSVLTHIVIPLYSRVIPVYSLTSLVLPLTHTSVLTLSVLTHIVIPLYSRVIPLYSLTPLVLPLTHSSPPSLSPHVSECSHPSLVSSHSPSHMEYHHTLTSMSSLCFHTECSHITCVLRECLFPLPWCRTTTTSSHSH